MDKYIPSMYKKSIFDINYDKLKRQNIECLLFDLDNTLLLVGAKKLSLEVVSLLKKLKKSFSLYIITNSGPKKEIVNLLKKLDIPYITFALKPFSFGFNKIIKKGYDKDKICIIGDQLMTDVLGGNRLGIFTILVEPLSSKDLKVTSFNRFLEKKKISKLTKLGLFRKGEFYE